MAGRLDRRITLKKPSEARGEDNEAQTVFVTVFENLPAGKIEKTYPSDEKAEAGHALRAEAETEWEIRFLGNGSIPQSSWRLIDEYGITHELISPAVEIGRRLGWSLRTRQVQ